MIFPDLGAVHCSCALIISAIKNTNCPVPKFLIFSNHTGFDTVILEDYTDRMKPYIAEWRKVRAAF